MPPIPTILAVVRAGFAALSGVPRGAWTALAGLALLLAANHWYRHQLAAARTAGHVEQATADQTALAAANTAAAAAQQRLAAELAARQTKVSKGTADALTARLDDLARRYDDFRLRWTARPGPDGPGDRVGHGLSGTAAGADGAACAAAGWVSLDTAAAAALAADRAIAKDDAWIAWAAAQRAAWPAD